MKCGIIGLPNIGKSTLFNIISNSNVISKNFPFSTINPNYGWIIDNDERLLKLQEIISMELNIIPSKIKLVDIAGLIKGSHKGEGLGNKFLSLIRETNIIIHVIRIFREQNISHIEGSINPIRDKEIIDMELQLKDLETIEKILKKNDISKHDIRIIHKIYDIIKQGNNVRTYKFSYIEKKILNNLCLLTYKPILYVCNTNKNLNQTDIENINKLKYIIKKEGAEILIFCKNFLSTFTKRKIVRIIKKHLGINNFFTIGNHEIRSWNIPNKCTAYQASKIIHSDFQKKFIKARIISYKNYIQHQSYKKIKNLGKIFIVGKDYLIKDGDIVHFIINQKKIH